MAVTIKLRQGVKANLPTTGMTLGEPLFATNTNELYVATGETTKAPIQVDLPALTAMGTVATDDVMYMYDVSEAATSVRGRKITFDSFKTALNSPPESTDEKVATASGATAGYLGTNGTDGVLRSDDGIGMTAGASNAFVTLSLKFASEAQGDMTYRGASAWNRLAAGAAGAILQSGGAAANPSWVTTIDGGTF
jgi:hypothetical protein